MRTRQILINRVRSRWNEYVLLGRWRRADRLKALLTKLRRSKVAPRKVDRARLVTRRKSA